MRRTTAVAMARKAEERRAARMNAALARVSGRDQSLSELQRRVLHQLLLVDAGLQQDRLAIRHAATHARFLAARRAKLMRALGRVRQGRGAEAMRERALARGFLASRRRSAALTTAAVEGVRNVQNFGRNARY